MLIENFHRSLNLCLAQWLVYRRFWKGKVLSIKTLIIFNSAPESVQKSFSSFLKVLF